MGWDERLHNVINNTNKRRAALHLLVWIMGAILLNFPGTDLTVGVFTSSADTLLLATLYATPLNMLLFYINASLVKHYFESRNGLYWLYFIGLFLLIALLETLIDLLYFSQVSQQLFSSYVVEMITTNLLLNFALFIIPSWVYGAYLALQKHADVAESITEEGANIELVEGKQRHLLSPLTLIFVKSDGNYCDIHCEDRILTLRISLSALLKQLPQYCTQCHRSYIVNRKKIQRSTHNSIILANHTIPIGRAFSANVRD